MASDDMNDPDLKAAIAASLGETNSSEDAFNASKRQDVIDLTGESDDPGDDDPDLKRAIELSIQGTGAEPGPSSDNTPSNERPMGLLGLDRKQMEQERVARLAKRKPEDASPLGEPEPKQQRTETPARDASYRDTVVGASNRPIELDEPTDNHSGNSQIRQPSTKPEVQFPDGVVKKTWAWGCDRKGDDIKLEEVFQKSDIDLAILSSFMWDMDWLFSKLDTKNSRFLLMMQAKDEHTVSSL